MDGLWTLMSVITLVSLAPFTIFAVIRYARTSYVLVYKRFKKPVQTTGVIEWEECVNYSQSGCYFIIAYSYIDNTGEQRTATFKWHEKIGWRGVGIVIHFDSQAPENSIADCQLEYGRRIWRNTLITIIVMIVFVMIGFLYNFKK